MVFFDSDNLVATTAGNDPVTWFLVLSFVPSFLYKLSLVLSVFILFWSKHMSIVRQRKGSAGAVAVSQMQMSGQPAKFDDQVIVSGHEYVSPYVLTAILRKGRYFYSDINHRCVLNLVTITNSIALCDFTLEKFDENTRKPYPSIYFKDDIELAGLYYPFLSIGHFLSFCVTEECKQLSLMQMKYDNVWINISDSKNLIVMSCHPDLKRFLEHFGHGKIYLPRSYTCKSK